VLRYTIKSKHIQEETNSALYLHSILEPSAFKVFTPLHFLTILLCYSLNLNGFHLDLCEANGDFKTEFLMAVIGEK
jgi:hypothetical protein